MFVHLIPIVWRVLNNFWQIGFVVSICAIWPVAAFAKDDGLIQWHSTNVQLLRGSGYALGSSQREIITVQHAHGWTLGDNMVFYDATLTGQDYFEWHSRLSLKKIRKAPVKIGPVKDILLASTLEVPEKGSARYLFGVGADWTIPGFKFFATNFYLRDNPDLAGHTWATTFAWKKTFAVRGQPFLFDGFVDMAGSEGTRSGYQLAAPTLLADIGTHMGQADKLFLGIEYQHWNNKFGLKDVDERVAQLQLRWVLD